MSNTKTPGKNKYYRDSQLSGGLHRYGMLDGLPPRQAGALVACGNHIKKEGRITSYADRKNWDLSVATEAPTSEHHRLAQTLAKRVESAQTQGASRVAFHYEMPPGRMSFPLVVEQRLKIANGEVPTVKPFALHRQVNSPHAPMSVGIVLDLSASMDAEGRMGGEMAWIIKQAIERIGGRSALVAHARNKAFPIVAPGEAMPKIPRFSHAIGAHEEDDALLLLDAAMDFYDTPGVRLLVIFGDGEVHSHAMLEQAIASGVRCLFVNREPEASRRIPSGAYHCSVSAGDMAGVSRQVGDALVDAVTTERNRLGVNA